MTEFEAIIQAITKIVLSYEFYVPVLTICLTFLIIRISARVVKKLVNKDSKSIEVKKRNTIVALGENILKYLEKRFNKYQIIIFTCTNREKEILEKLELPINLINIE